MLENLSQKLTREFGKGFSLTNLKLMRQFFIAYSSRIGQTLSDQSFGNRKSRTLSGQSEKTQISSAQLTRAGYSPFKFTLSWSHYIFLLGIDNDPERSFYEIEAAEQNGRYGNLGVSLMPVCMNASL